MKSCRGAKSRPGRWSGEVFLAPVAGFTLVVQLLEYQGLSEMHYNQVRGRISHFPAGRREQIWESLEKNLIWTTAITLKTFQ